ncbi:MOSC domain-containing protein [Streptomyces sp. NBC_01808]|uniref:MOSC domain-containing protein n=1 Tax=Streptomyces sp. NBC_01808 TaxID=2975947 RepID=UPI002DDB6D81|nr:MOSC domain-containing protein [Streptomyces sp. NBC_01808]WSA38274.1 MOSC domain-containing protein [Streptomyces sp. NBC_01808]
MPELPPAIPAPPPSPEPSDPTVAMLRRFPVKSMLGERLPELVIDERGTVGDRLWAVTYGDGKLGSGKNSRRFRRTEGLLHFSASYAAAHDPGSARPHVVTPEGSGLRDDAHLAELLGVDARLAREDAVSHYDDCGVTLIGTASLHALGLILGDTEPADARRFRKNILLDTEEPWIEEDWVGREIAVGDEVRLRVVKRMKRCVMTTMAQRDLPEDRRVLKTLTADRGMCIGVGADVLNPGTVRLGDTVRPV